MRRALVVPVLVLAACGPASAPAAAPGCDVELAGNFAETSRAPASCPTLGSGAGATRGHTLLQLRVPARALHGDFAITIDLGPAPTIGPYRAATTELWSATGIRHVAPAGACLFQAGNNTTPTSDFALDVTSLAPIHGTLALRMFVLARTSDDGHQTECGPGTTEELRVRF